MLNDDHHVAIAVTSGPKATEVSDIPTENYTFKSKTVKVGDKNASVLLLQEILRARGFKGKYGKILKLTWKADGICGPATWKDLIAI